MIVATIPGWVWLAAYPWLLLLVIAWLGGSIENALQRDPETSSAGASLEGAAPAENTNPRTTETA